MRRFVREHDDPTKPKDCGQCEEWQQAGKWSADRCRPCYRETRYGEFAPRMWALWCAVGRGEIIDAETGDTNWSIDWAAFREARDCRHPLTLDDEPAELFDAITLIRAELQRPTGELLMELARDEADG